MIMRKDLFLKPNLKQKTIYILLICLGISLLYMFMWMQQESKYELVIFDQESKEEYLREEVEIGHIVQMRWRHSVELTTWQDTLEVQDGKFILIETRFENFGAGVSPTTEGKIRIEDGFVVMYDLAEIHENYRWIHSQKQQFTLAKNRKDILLYDQIPHHRKVEMIIEKR